MTAERSSRREPKLGRPECICNHHLFVELIGAGAVVLDLGAYEGVFARAIAERTGARVLAVEASPVMFERLPVVDRVENLNLAVGGEEGRVKLYAGSDPQGTSMFSEHPAAAGKGFDVPAVTLRGLMTDRCGGRLDLLKVNIEGAEIPMLDACDDRTLQAIGQMTIQFHDFLPELDQAADVRRTKERLCDLGFGEILFKAPNKDVLFVNLRAGVMGRGRFVAEKALVRLKQYRRALAKKLGLG